MFTVNCSVKVSLKGGFVSTKKEVLKVARRSNVLDKMPNRASQAQSHMASVNSSEAAAAAVLPPVSSVSQSVKCRTFLILNLLVFMVKVLCIFKI